MLEAQTLINDFAVIAGYCSLYKLQHFRKQAHASSQNVCQTQTFGQRQMKCYTDARWPCKLIEYQDLQTFYT